MQTLQAFGLSDIGKVRRQNQDSIYYSTKPVGPLPNLFVVADGMGGHNAGEVASRQSIYLFTDYIENHRAEPEDFMDLCVSAAQYANYMIHGQAKRNPELYGMGTTFSACFLLEKICQAVHVGDSRVYMSGENGSVLSQLTQDHSYVYEMVRAGQITPEEAAVHPKRNILTRVIGVDEDVEIDGYTRSLDNIEKVLLCSDGLFGMLPNETIKTIIKSEAGIEERVKALVTAANEAGGHDNISAILIDLKG